MGTSAIKWPFLPGRTVVGATVGAADEGYRVEFVDSMGTVLNVTLTEAALFELAGSSCVLTEEVDQRRDRAQRRGRSPSTGQDGPRGTSS